MIYGNKRNLTAFKNQLYEAWNDWADKRDDASDKNEKQIARYIARNLEQALCKVEKAISFLD